MKKLVLALGLGAATLSAGAQTVVKDTVAVGAGYANQVYYSLANDVQKTAPINDWDIAFELKDIISGVQLNSVVGNQLWKYPKGNLASGWATIDTAGMSSWKQRNNSDTNWSMGAIGMYADMNTLNLDWGNYNMSTHAVTGDSLFIIKLSTGAYKKFAIENLIGGVYTFKYANLDGSGLQTMTATKSNYPGKNFVYLNMRTNTLIDREPANWDLLFSQYFADLGIMYYGVTGVLQNRGVQAVKVNRPSDAPTYNNYAAHTFGSKINTIGYDWKTFTGGAYVIKDTTVYFVRTAGGDIWKMIFTGFGGNTTGNCIFSKEKLYTKPTGVANLNNQFGFVVYPNPASGSDVQLIADLTGNNAPVSIEVFDMSGRIVRQINAGTLSGLQQIALPASSLVSGNYVVRVNSALGAATQRLIVR